MTLNKLFTLVEQRNISVSNEFAARLKAFAHESEKNSGYTIGEIEGSWPRALESFINIKGNKLIYLDAPYTRDEYSRYYHILETLVEYKYINLLGIGRVPDKKAGFRFSSDFFTKTTNKLKDTYANLILAILKNGISCAWSYSDSATISTAEIIYEIHKKVNCKIASYATPYTLKHKVVENLKKSKSI